MIRRLFRLIALAGAAAGAVAVVRALSRKQDPLPSAGGPSGEAWPPLRNESPAAPAPSVPKPATKPSTPKKPAMPKQAVVAPEPAGVPVAASGTNGWVQPGPDGSCPASHPVKAKLSSKIFHAPGQLNYDRTTPDRCYVDASAAEADGLRAAKR